MSLSTRLIGLSVGLAETAQEMRDEDIARATYLDRVSKELESIAELLHD